MYLPDTSFSAEGGHGAGVGAAAGTGRGGGLSEAAGGQRGKVPDPFGGAADGWVYDPANQKQYNQSPVGDYLDE